MMIFAYEKVENFVEKAEKLVTSIFPFYRNVPPPPGSFRGALKFENSMVNS